MNDEKLKKVYDNLEKACFFLKTKDFDIALKFIIKARESITNNIGE